MQNDNSTKAQRCGGGERNQIKRYLDERTKKKKKERI